MAAKTREIIKIKAAPAGDLVTLETFWYEATVMRNRNGMAVLRKQQGSLQATSALGALDQLANKAKDTWRGQIMNAKVYEIDKEGEIVATTSSERTLPLDDDESQGCDTERLDIWEWATIYTAPSFATFKG